LTATPKLDNSIFQLGDVRVDPALDEIPEAGPKVTASPHNWAAWQSAAAHRPACASGDHAGIGATAYRRTSRQELKYAASPPAARV
jgi:hypothetical protein